MRNILVALLCCVAPSMQLSGQDTITVNQVTNIQFLDTVTITLTSEAPVTDIRFLHPTYADAFWGGQHLADWIINSYGLTSTSSQFVIVSSIADFYKRHDLHVNSALVQATTAHPGSAISTIDHWSIQCGNYADKVANTCDIVTAQLGIASITFRRVSLSGHQIMEYYDATLSKWIFMDPDPGTAVFVPRDHGALVSFSEIQSDPTILLDSTTSTWWALAANDSASRQQYYNFMVPMLGTVNYSSANYVTDNRDALYRLPEGATMQFTMINNKVNIPVDSMIGDNLSILDDCITAFMSNDSIGMNDCAENVATLSGINPSVVIEALGNGNTFITHGVAIVGPKDDEGFCSVLLQPGDYTFTELCIPNLLRSIEPTHEGIAFSVNGVTYTDSTFFQMYWPVGTSYLGNPQYVDPTTIQYGINDVSIPDSVGPVTLTFYFNHKLFEFWEHDWQLLVFNGSLQTSQIDSTGTSSIDDYLTAESTTLYPNPTNGILHVSQQVDQIAVYSLTGSLVATQQFASQIDISLLPAGIYCVTIRNSKDVFSKKIIKQ